MTKVNNTYCDHCGKSVDALNSKSPRETISVYDAVFRNVNLCEVCITGLIVEVAKYLNVNQE